MNTTESVVFAERGTRPGTGPVGLPRTTLPPRSTMQPYAFTTTNARILVSPLSRYAPPCPASSAPVQWLAVADRPAPRAPSGNRPGRIARTAARPSSLSG